MMDFKTEVRKLIEQIPRGSVSTPRDIARCLGDLKATRGIAEMIKDGIVHNHRVVTSDDIKDNAQKRLLKTEGVRFRGNRIMNFGATTFKDFSSDYPLRILRDEQNGLSEKIKTYDDFNDIERVCGIDVAYSNDTAFCSLAILDYETKNLIEMKVSMGRVSFPYIPTYFAYREFEMMKPLAEVLDKKSDILFVNGHGILHPRKFGLATHLGMKLNLITIGVAKSKLCGGLKRTPLKIGDHSEVRYEYETRGFALKTSQSKRLIFVSPGHRISLETAFRITKEFTLKKMPEPLGKAHAHAMELKLASKKEKK